jgi:hypothetical protein
LDTLTREEGLVKTIPNKIRKRGALEKGLRGSRRVALNQ